MRFLILAFTVSVMSCAQDQHKIVKHQNIIDTSQYSILKFDKANNYYFDKNVKPSTLSAEEIVRIESLISKRILEYNRTEKDSAIVITKRIREKKHDPNFTWEGDSIQHPSAYYKQLIAVINSKGEKEVWVNCFCNTGEKSYWKKSVVMVSDGGSCYFSLKINLTKNTISDFGVNGVA